MVFREYPKVLVISHNAFSSTRNNGKTLSSIFKDWPRDKIAQLYFYPEQPEFSICDNFYRVTDGEVFRSVFSRRKICGSVITKDSDVSSEGKSIFSSLYKMMAGFRSDFFLLLRDIVWSIGRWKTIGLKEWIDSFNPEIIFFVSSESRFSYDIAFWAADRCKVASFYVYCTDDYVLPKLTLSPFFWVKHFSIKKRFRHAVHISRKVFVIGEIMKDVYSRTFGGDYTILANTVDVLPLQPVEKPSSVKIRFVYTGSLLLKRWQALLDIGRCLSQLNSQCPQSELLIYSSVTPAKNILKRLSSFSCMRFCGGLNAGEVSDALDKADILVFAESFTRGSRHTARLSFSTKIPEYLAHGKCILAYGPPDVGSIKYLEKYRLAVIAHNKVELLRQLIAMIENPALRYDMGKKAQEFAQERLKRINILDCF